MDDKEFKDLQLFGKTIEKKPVDHTKNIKNNKNHLMQIKKVNNSKSKKHLKLLCYKTCVFIHKLPKNVKTIFMKLKEKNLELKNTRYIKKIHKKKTLIACKKNDSEIKKVYRLVETCKKRRNKTIIIRKRLLVPLKTYYMQPGAIDTPALFYLTFKDTDECKNVVKPEAYTILKKSIWDFPVKNKKK